MGALKAAPLLEDVRRAVSEVTDPELPVATIEELGIMEDVRVDGSSCRVEVDLIPTFLGCPALEMIRSDVTNAARSVPGVGSVEVRFRAEPQWTPERITAEGRKHLAEGLTIAVRGPVGEMVCPVCGSETVEERSPFGPTACRAVAYCDACRNPVEVIRQ